MGECEQSSKKNFLKSKDRFLFVISEKNGVTTKNRCTVASPCEKINIFVNGVIYNNDEKQLIEGFLSYGTDYIEKIDGSFVIFMIKEKEFFILTDKVNSKKAFYASIDGVWYISNDIDALPKQRCQLSLDGLACYLANGVMLNDLTLFKEIRSAKRASVHAFKDGDLAIDNYWDFVFEYSSNSSINREQCQQKLKSLIISAIKRRYVTAKDISISLSAGYDVRGILGIFHTIMKAQNVSCFSYATAGHSKNSCDAALSKKLALLCGYPHQIVLSYRGNLIDHLEKNATEGKCLSNFCDELDAWHEVAEFNQFSDIFVGDHCFGGVDRPLDSREIILDSVKITGASGISWLEGFLSKETFQKMSECLCKLTDAIFESTDGILDPHDKNDFLRLDQRINHKLMPWRENFSSQCGFVHNPYLDGEILDFMRKLPPEFRKGKALFRDTIRNIMPEMFSVKRATSTGYSVDWYREIRRNKDLLISYIEENDSRLETIVTKSEIVDMIKCQSSMIERARVFLIRVINYLRRKSRFAERLIDILVGPRIKPSGSAVNSDRLLLRLLLVRIFLSPSESND